MRLRHLILCAVFLIFSANPCLAAGVGIGGSLEAGPTYYAGSDDTIFESVFRMKLDLNKDEKQSGVLLLQYKAKTPESANDPGDGYNTLLVNQAYLDLTLSSNSMLRVGRQKISWGSGLAWNPTNYIGADKNRTDLSDEFPGVDTADFETVFGQSSLVVAVKPNRTLHDWGQAVKYATRVSHSDLAFSAYRQGRANALGIDWATSWGDYTIYAEIASKAGTGRFYIADSGGTLTLTSRPDGIRYWNGVLGVNRTFGGDLTVQLEYYSNEAGWSAAEARNYFNYINAPAHESEIGDLARKTTDLFADLRRSYLYMLIRKAEAIEDLTLAARLLWNMDDGSLMMTPMAEYRLGQNSSATIMVNIFTGDGMTELGAISTGTQYITKLTISF